MFSSTLLRNVSPIGLLPRGLTTLQAAEPLALDVAAFRAQLEGIETPAKSADEEPDLRPQDEETDSEEEERKQQELRIARIKRETQELLLLQDFLPYLLQSNRLNEAEGAVCCFVDRNPRNADGFVLLADLYSHRDGFAASCECLWGAIYNSPGNRMLLRLLRNSEEQFLLRQCDLPLSFKLKSLKTTAVPEDSIAPSADIFDSIFRAEGAPVVVIRQGKQVAAVANRDLEPGDVVFRQRPFVLTPLMLESGQIYNSCFHCLQDREDPTRGFSCPVKPYTCPFVFCSWECLMRNSRIHALECQAIPLLMAAAKESKLSPTTVLHIFRTIAKTGLERQVRQNHKNADDSEEPTTDVIEQLLSLNSYRAAVIHGQPELYRQLTILARRLQRVLPGELLLFLSESDLIDLMLVLWQYSPFLTSPSIASAVEQRNPDGAVGQVLAPAVALLHHSCVPTCGLSLQEDGLIAVRALTFIPAGGSLCVSLEEDLFKPQRDRKGVTAPPRVFGCGCLRCTDSAEGGRRLRGIRCFSCVRGFLCPYKSKSLSSRLHAYSAAIATSTEPSHSGQAAGDQKFELEMAEMLALQNRDTPTSSGGVDHVGAPDGKQPHEGDATLDEEWLCTCCGLASAAVSRSCALLESAVERHQAAAGKALVRGARLKALKEYASLVQQYSSQLHPQHAVLFNSHIVLAGLLACQPAKDPPQALIYIRRAAIAAETVLPPSSRLKMDLYLKLAELTYQAMQYDQHCRRGPSLPSNFIMGPMYSALWNCCVCFGSDSSLAIVLQQKLRRYASVLGVYTPPLLHKPVLRTVDVFVGLYRQTATASSHITSALSSVSFSRFIIHCVCGSFMEGAGGAVCVFIGQAIADHFSRDPMFLAVALVRRGFCFPLTLEVFMAMKDIPHLPTGLTLLGLACVHKQVQIVKELLKMGFDIFFRTAFGVTALLAMCAGTKRHAELPDDLGNISPQSSEDAITLDDSSRKEAAILRLLLQRCEELDSQEPTRPKVLLRQNQPGVHPDGTKRSEGIRGILQEETCSQVWSHRNRLLNACTHKLLGRSSALHLAASAGKARLCWQILAAGSLIGTLNAESATALHLACIVGDLDTVRVLLDHGAQVDATTLRGETPLVMAAYNLHTKVCVLLLERGADPSLVTRAEHFSVLHAVAAGVTRQVSMRFRGLSWEGDSPAAALSGLSQESAELGIYTKANTYIAQEALVDVRLPSASPVNSEIFLFPRTMLERTKKAKDLLLVMMKHCPDSAYTQQSRKGLSPADLLLRMWDAFVDKREKILQISDLQLEGQTRDERKYTEGGWEFVLRQMFTIRDMLSLRLYKPTRSAYVDTPRQDELQERSKTRLISEAPWLFPELIQRAAPSPRPALHRKTFIPRGPKVGPVEAPGVPPKVTVVGTGIEFLPGSAQTKETLRSKSLERDSSDASRQSTWLPPDPAAPPKSPPPPETSKARPPPKAPTPSGKGVPETSAKTDPPGDTRPPSPGTETPPASKGLLPSKKGPPSPPGTAAKKPPPKSPKGGPPKPKKSPPSSKPP